MAYAEPEPPDPAALATIPDRRRHPRWKKVELGVDDDPRGREQAGITVIGAVPGAGAPEGAYAKSVSTWAGIAAYLETRDALTTV
jgi:hypothetical protein